MQFCNSDLICILIRPFDIFRQNIATVEHCVIYRQQQQKGKNVNMPNPALLLSLCTNYLSNKIRVPKLEDDHLGKKNMEMVTGALHNHNSANFISTVFTAWPGNIQVWQTETHQPNDKVHLVKLCYSKYSIWFTMLISKNLCILFISVILMGTCEFVLPKNTSIRWTLVLA